MSSGIFQTWGRGAVGSAIQRCEAPPKDSPTNVTIRIGVFFDGTFNNRTNVASGKEGTEKGTSYSNDYSNIALLQRYRDDYSGYTYSSSVYIEGVGTTDNNRDSKASAATGYFRRGIISKVDKAMGKVIEIIRTKVRDAKRINKVHIDTLGFSRGAAAARNFVHRVLHDKGKTLKDQLIGLGYEVGVVEVKFVGLFDTVAAYGFNHSDNTRNLNLNAIRSAEKVVQLVAAEEYRKNFRLTNIASARNGLEIFLPGAHSDVGGGYTHNDDEVERQLLYFDTLELNEEQKAAVERDKKWLVECGWYLPTELAQPFLYGLKATRRKISNRYSRIPLQLMASYAQKSGIRILPSFATKNEVPKQLETLYDVILKTCPESVEFWSDFGPDYMKKIRHEFFHFSAYYGASFGANEPQFSNDNPLTGCRQRVIQYG